MQPIDKDAVQKAIDRFRGQDVYLHLETTNGAYATHRDERFFNANAYIRNARIRFNRGKLTGDGPYRAGLKLDLGWVYAEGLTDWEVDEKGRLLLAGHNEEGKLAVALELSLEPFE